MQRERALLSSCSNVCGASGSAPLAQLTLVMTTSAPSSLQAAAMRSSSVATITLLSVLHRHACCQVRTTMGTPMILTRGLPGKRMDWYRAGMTPICRAEVLEGSCNAPGICQDHRPNSHHVQCTR